MIRFLHLSIMRKGEWNEKSFGYQYKEKNILRNQTGIDNLSCILAGQTDTRT